MRSLTVEELKKHMHYDPETGVFTRISGRSDQLGVAGHNNRKGYVVIKIKQLAYKAHTLAILYCHGVYPTQVDHINGVKNDNRIANLREASNFVQAQNKRKPMAHNASGYLGVCKHPNKGKWVAMIGHNGCSTYLGIFDAPEKAAQAYLDAKRILHQGCTI